MNFGPYIVGATIIHLCLLVIHVPFCSGFRAYAKSNFLRCTGFLRRQWAIEREKRRHFRRSSLLLLWRLFSPLFTPYGLEDGSCSGLERRWGLEYGRGSRTLCARSLSALCRWCARERAIALRLAWQFCTRSLAPCGAWGSMDCSWFGTLHSVLKLWDTFTWVLAKFLKTTLGFLQFCCSTEEKRAALAAAKVFFPLSPAREWEYREKRQL